MNFEEGGSLSPAEEDILFRPDAHLQQYSDIRKFVQIREIVMAGAGGR
jgi:hypothetical protein